MQRSPGKVWMMQQWTTLLSISAFCVLHTASAGRQPLAESKVSFLHLYSALHDPIAGVVRVFADAYPTPHCNDVQTCTFEGDAHEDVLFTVPAKPEIPFGGLQGDPNKPDPMECFITCDLPAGNGNTTLGRILLKDAAGNLRASMQVERIETPAVKKGVGLCVGPVFSDVPQYDDWILYHLQLGIEGMHVYVANVDKERSHDVFGRGRPGQLHNTLTHRHMVTLHEYFLAEDDVPSHYFSQFVIVNECIWRHRQLYEFIAYIDRDEFIHVPGQEIKDVNLAGMLRKHLEGTVFASAALFTAVYRVVCSRERVPLIGHQDGSHVRPDVFEDYQGYDLWGKDTRQPDFTNCTSDWFGDIFKPPGRQCHTKSIVRPLLVDLEVTHYVARTTEGYERIPRPLDPTQVFLKHLRCQAPKGEGQRAPVCERKDPVNYANGVDDGVEVCPEDQSSSAKCIACSPDSQA